MVKIIRLLRGYIIFSVSGSCPERFVNTLIRSGINVWGVRSSDGIVFCRTKASNYRLISKISRRSNSKIRIKSKRGLPFFIHKNRNRVGILTGLVCFVLIFKLLSLFIWNVDLYGFENMSYNHAKDVMERVGVYEGAYGNYESLKNIQTKALIEFDNVSWITVNVDGSQGEVNISEIEEEGEIQDSSPCNIKATTDGQVIRVDSYSGLSVVKSGDAVVKGNLLISGFVETELGGTHLESADGVVWARTERTERFKIKKISSFMKYDENFGKRYSAKIFNLTVPLTFAQYSAEKNYFIFLNEKKAEFNGRTASVSLIGENVYFYGEENVLINRESAQKLFNAELLLNELFSYGDKKIIDRTVNCSDDNDNFYYEVNYVCEEDIGEKSEIILDDTFSIDNTVEPDSE